VYRMSRRDRKRNGNGNGKVHLISHIRRLRTGTCKLSGRSKWQWQWQWQGDDRARVGVHLKPSASFARSTNSILSILDPVPSTRTTRCPLLNNVIVELLADALDLDAGTHCDLHELNCPVSLVLVVGSGILQQSRRI
jgi:hypothetical protein